MSYMEKTVHHLIKASRLDVGLCGRDNGDKKRYAVSTDCRMLHLLPIESEEREVLGVGSIRVAIITSCQDMKTIVL